VRQRLGHGNPQQFPRDSVRRGIKFCMSSSAAGVGLRCHCSVFVLQNLGDEDPFNSHLTVRFLKASIRI
jgi:hypothetical protein